MRTLLVDVGSTLLATLLFWMIFGACVDSPAATTVPLARVIALWDPLACTGDHRVALELADDVGAVYAGSAPCELGGVIVDTPHFGSFHARVRALEPTGSGASRAARAAGVKSLVADSALAPAAVLGATSPSTDGEAGDPLARSIALAVEVPLIRWQIETPP